MSGSRAERMNIEQIHVVFKTHFDIGFTDLASAVVERYGRRMLPDVIKTCEDTATLDPARFVWTMSAWPLVQSLLADHASAEDIERAEGLLRRGQLAWHLLPYTTHTEFCGLEEFIRGFRFSRDLSDRYGHRPISAKMTDVPGHTWILPTLLHKAGIRFLHLGCNSACTPPDVPRLFFWEGPDGSRVLTFYSKGSYGTPLLPPEDWSYPVWLALMQTNDNVGPQGPDVIERILSGVGEEVPGARVVVGTLDGFYDAISRFPLDDVPVVRGDLADTWIHGVGSYPMEVAQLRSVRMQLAEAEKAMSLAGMLGVLDGNALSGLNASITRAFEQSLLFGEHTWGLNVIVDLRQRYYAKREFLAHKQDKDVLRMEESCDEQRGRMKAAAQETAAAQSQALSALAANVDADGPRLVVFSGLGWTRDAWVDVSALRLADGDTAFDVQACKPLPTVWVDGVPMTHVPALPTLGYRTLTACKGQAARQELSCHVDSDTIENKWFRIRVDAVAGTVASLMDKRTGREWVDGSSGYGLGQYRYDIYGIDDITEFIRTYSYRFPAWMVEAVGRMDYPEIGHSVHTATDFKVTSQSNGMYSSLVLSTQIQGRSVTEFGNALELETRITLYETEPHIDLTIRLKGKQETPYVEAGHVVLPFNLQNHHVRINKLGCVLDPLTDIVKDANHGLYCCENWVELSDGEDGMAVIPFDMPLFSMGDQRIYQYKREPSAQPPVLFFNLFNNSWGTNFPQWMGGDYTFRYRLIPHKGDWREGHVQKIALESVTPVLTGMADGGMGGLPAAKSLLELPEGIAALALKPAYDGEGYVLRLRELDGQEKSCVLDLPWPVDCMPECDLLEAEIAQGARVQTMHPFDIRSLRIPAES